MPTKFQETMRWVEANSKRGTHEERREFLLDVVAALAERVSDDVFEEAVMRVREQRASSEE